MHGRKTIQASKMRPGALTPVDDVIDLKDSNLNLKRLEPSIVVIVYLIKDLVNEPVKEPVKQPAKYCHGI